MTDLQRKRLALVRPRLIGPLQGFSPDKAYCVPDAHGYCATCSDEALPARVIQVDEALWTATVEINGQTSEVDVSLVDRVTIGQMLLVHGGVAISLAEQGSGG
jgi:HupF/HypC family